MMKPYREDVRRAAEQYLDNKGAQLWAHFVLDHNEFDQAAEWLTEQVMGVIAHSLTEEVAAHRSGSQSWTEPELPLGLEQLPPRHRHLEP